MRSMLTSHSPPSTAGSPPAGSGTETTNTARSMDGQADGAAPRSRYRRWPAYAAMLGISLVACVLIGWASRDQRSMPADHSLVYYTVRPRNLGISVTAQGAMQSQENVEVICKVDNLPNDGVYGAAISWMIENGSWVEKGDLLVELDATYLRERVDEQLIETIRARGNYTARKLDYENRLTLNETLKANAELAVQKAKLRLRQFGDEQGGTYQIALQSLDMKIRQRTASQSIADRNQRGTEQLHELGYKSVGDLAQVRLRSIRAKAEAKRAMDQRRQLVAYDHVRSLRELEGQVEAAERALVQVEGENEAKRLQNKVWMQWAELSLKWKEQYLARYRQQLKDCKIYAPVSGLVAYYVESNRWGRTSTLEPGDAVRYGQPIMVIPDLQHMQAEISLHETVVDRVQVGMPATLRLETFPDRRYKATVRSIDVLPDPGNWFGSDTKHFTAIVTVDQEVDQVRPGMTAVVEIDIADLQDVLCVPVQAVVQREGQSWCYRARPGTPEKCLVEIGETNHEFVEILAGLESGDRVLMDPSAVLDVDQGPLRDIAPDTNRPSGLMLR